jgi:hypothetical protein
MPMRPANRWEGNIKMAEVEDKVAGFCRQGNEVMGSIRGTGFIR